MCSFLYVLGSPSRNCSAVGHRPHRRHPGVRLQHSVRRRQESNPGAAAGSRAGQIPRNRQDDCQSLSGRRVSLTSGSITYKSLT